MRKLKDLNGFSIGKKLTIAIDVDGTVADCSKVDFNKVANNPSELMKAIPVKGALDAVKKLYRQGHKIVFHSSRNYGSKGVTSDWLKKHRFPFHHIEMDKFVAHIYIDDRAINGCNWKHVMKEIKKPGLPGKLARKKGMV
jgi:predicted secreted acid phosphatase